MRFACIGPSYTTNNLSECVNIFHYGNNTEIHQQSTGIIWPIMLTYTTSGLTIDRDDIPRGSGGDPAFHTAQSTIHVSHQLYTFLKSWNTTDSCFPKNIYQETYINHKKNIEKPCKFRSSFRNTVYVLCQKTLPKISLCFVSFGFWGQWQSQDVTSGYHRISTSYVYIYKHTYVCFTSPCT